MDPPCQADALPTNSRFVSRDACRRRRMPAATRRDAPLPSSRARFRRASTDAGPPRVSAYRQWASTASEARSYRAASVDPCRRRASRLASRSSNVVDIGLIAIDVLREPIDGMPQALLKRHLRRPPEQVSRLLVLAQQSLDFAVDRA